MRKNILIIGLAGMIGMSSGFISCSPDYETEFNVEKLVIPDNSQASITFPLTGGESVIEVQTNVPFGNWHAKSNAEWCKLEPQKDKVVVTAGENGIYTTRQAEITISYGHQSYSITVSQFGLEPVILIDGKNEGYIKEIDAETELITIPVTTNLDLDNIIIPDTCAWVHLAEQPKSFKTRADNVNKQDLKFTLDQSTDTIVRYCTVLLQSSQNYSYINTFLIKQQPRGYIVEIDESKKIYEVKAMGETIIVPFKVNGPAKAYSYEIEESAKTWITPVPATRALRDASESFIIEPNIAEIEKPREGHITFISTDPKHPNQFTVTVKQAGFIPVPPVNVVNATAVPEAGRINLQWEMPENVDFNKIEITYYDQVVKENKKIEIDGFKTISAIIDDTYQCAGEYTFTIKTYGPTGLETDTPVTVTGTSGEAAKLEHVNLTTDMLSANATEPSEGSLDHLVDGSTGTGDYYHTMYNSTAPNNAAHYVQIELSTPLQNLCFEYDGRRNGDGGGDVKRVLITGCNADPTDEGNWERMGVETFNMPTARGGHATPNENVMGRQAYRYIRFTPEACRRLDPLNPTVASQAWWNMAKMYLYRIRHDEAWAKEQLGI